MEEVETADRLKGEIDGYTVIAHVRGSIGSGAVKLGRRGKCRYCGCEDPRVFRNVSHAVPEALGNKWLRSLDECDRCNVIFARYDDALAASIGPILTVGGTQGKRNRVRQTGRTGGPAVIRHQRPKGRRHISMEVRDSPFENHVRMNPKAHTITFTIPAGTERFVPRHAYKALMKMALAIMLEDELSNFRQTAAWLLDPSDAEEMGELLVGLSFASVGNAPPLATGTLLRRIADSGQIPYMIFVMSIGSVCFQLALEPDTLDGPVPPRNSARIGLSWTNVVQGEKEEVRFAYGRPQHLDWSSTGLDVSPIESLITTVDLRSNSASIVPKLRRAGLTVNGDDSASSFNPGLLTAPTIGFPK